MRSRGRRMDLEQVEARIEEAIPGAEAHVFRARGPEDDDHLAARVVAASFDGESLVDRHQRVYDALDDLVTTEIHALEVETYTPAEWDGEDLADR